MSIRNYTERRSRGGTTYSADFSFRTESGEQMKVHKTFPREVLDDFESGRPVNVMYLPLPGRASEMRFEKESPSTFVLVAGIALVLCGAGCLWVALAGRKTAGRGQEAAASAL